MMKLLVPLGLLGLLGLLALLLIYIIKPNFFVKYTSSNHIWKLAMKYKRKRVVTNKLRNILIIICQVLIVICIALILAQPVIDNNVEGDANEAIIILDSSASMRTVDGGGTTRFERAIDGVIQRFNSTLINKSYASIILADDDPRFLARRVDTANALPVIDNLRDMQIDENSCSYASADISGAMQMTEDVLKVNPSAKIFLYTDSDYEVVPDGVTVVNVSDKEEWNLGIINATATVEEGSYVINVRAGLFGKSDSYSVNIEIEKMDGNKEIFSSDRIFFAQDEPVTVIFKNEGGANTDINNQIYYVNISGTSAFSNFKSIRVYFDDVIDSFADDNEFFIYGGNREIIRVQYVSDEPNPFYETLISQMPGFFANNWEIRYDLKTRIQYEKGDYATSGYDFYIFEHAGSLQTLPTDGVVLFMDPPSNQAIPGLNVNVAGTVGEDSSVNRFYFTAGDNHPITSQMKPENLFVTKYSILTYNSIDPQVLFYCENHPAGLLIDEEIGGRPIKAVVLPFSVHNTDPRLPEFVILFYSIFEYFFPPTVEKYSYEVNETVQLNSMGPYLEFEETKYEEFPLEMKFSKPGTYKFKQSSYFGKELQDVMIYVSLPQAECAINAKLETIKVPTIGSDKASGIDDLVVWFAAGLVALMLLEWILHSFEHR